MLFLLSLSWKSAAATWLVDEPPKSAFNGNYSSILFRLLGLVPGSYIDTNTSIDHDLRMEKEAKDFAVPGIPGTDLMCSFFLFLSR